MKWQDVVLSLGSAVLMCSLLPSVLTPNKPAAATSLTTAIVLAAFTVVYADLRLWATTALTAASAALWAALWLQTTQF
jgi:hypothetical protein